MPNFRIPKQTDRSLIEALKSICDEARAEFKVTLNIRIRPFEGPAAQELQIQNTTQQQDQLLDRLLAEETQIVPTFWIRGAGKRVYFDALWRRVSKGGGRDVGAASSG